MGHIRIPKRYHSIPVQYIIGMSILMYFSVVYKNKRLYPPKLNSTSASYGPERLEMVSKKC